MTDSFPIKRVENIRGWITSCDAKREYGSEYRFNGVLETSPYENKWAPPDPEYYRLPSDGDNVELIRQIYYKKIGELGTHWTKDMPISFQYARIKMSDVINHYTTKEGVLRIPRWASFKFAVDEYLTEAPHLKFHPTRVAAFVEQHGVERLEDMDAM